MTEVNGNDKVHDNSMMYPTHDQIKSQFDCLTESSPMYVSFIHCASARVLKVGREYITVWGNKRIKWNQVLECWW